MALPVDTTPVASFSATAQSGVETVTFLYRLYMTRAGATFQFHVIAGNLGAFRKTSVDNRIRCMADQGSLITIEAGSESFGYLLEGIASRCTRARACVVVEKEAWDKATK